MSLTQFTKAELEFIRNEFYASLSNGAEDPLFETIYQKAKTLAALGAHRKSASFYVHHNGAAAFVKEGNFFRSQNGLMESWGRAWKGIDAGDLDHAREICEDMHKRGLI